MTALSKIIITAVFGIILTGMLGGLIIRPAWSAVNLASGQLRQNQAILVSLNQQLAALRAAQTDIKKATKSADIIDWILDRETLVTAVKELEGAAALTAVSKTLDIADLDPTQPKPDLVAGKRGVDEVAYRITTTSDYLGLINFLSYLEHLPHWTEITKINLSAEVKQSDTGQSVRTGKVLGTVDGIFFVNHTSHVQN